MEICIPSRNEHRTTQSFLCGCGQREPAALAPKTFGSLFTSSQSRQRTCTKEIAWHCFFKIIHCAFFSSILHCNSLGSFQFAHVASMRFLHQALRWLELYPKSWFWINAFDWPEQTLKIYMQYSTYFACNNDLCSAVLTNQLGDVFLSFLSHLSLEEGIWEE